MKLNFSLDAALLIAFISAFLYMIGQVYFGSYLKPFQGDILVLNFSIQDKIFIGFLKILNHFFYFITGIILLFIIIPTFAHQFKFTAWLTSKLRTIQREMDNEKKHIPKIHNDLSIKNIDEKFNKNFKYGYTLLILITLFLFYIQYIQDNTIENATKNFENPEKRLLKISIKERTDEEAYKILCGQNLCAVLVVNGKEKSLQYIDPKEISFPLQSTNK